MAMFSAAVIVLSLWSPKAVYAAKCSQTCTYQFTADLVWSATTHPQDYPSSAHWSPFFTVPHGESFVLWRNATLSSSGIQEIAELGTGKAFKSEVTACGAACGPSVQSSCDPYSGTCKAAGMVSMTPEHHYVSTASMIAPSPDWFVGVDSMDLCENGTWAEEVMKDAVLYDAGTDDGETYSAPNAPSSPAMPIFMLPTGPDSILYNSDEGKSLNFGTMKFTKMKCEGAMPEAGAGAPPPASASTPPVAPGAAASPATSNLGGSALVAAGSFIAALAFF